MKHRDCPHRVVRSWMERATEDEVEDFFDDYYRAHGLREVSLEKARELDRELTKSGRTIGRLLMLEP